ncbi:MAG: hypothetical protein GQ573_08280 [Gammaproteobacteria bacterium]|nr:hypothetical protein [Gammaproteobacteria bacterium]
MCAHFSTVGRQDQFWILFQLPAGIAIGLDLAVLERLSELSFLPGTAGMEFHINHVTSQLQSRLMVGEGAGQGEVKFAELLLIGYQAGRGKIAGKSAIAL